jgi:hypothetical protein
LLCVRVVHARQRYCQQQREGKNVLITGAKHGASLSLTLDLTSQASSGAVSYRGQEGGKQSEPYPTAVRKGQTKRDSLHTAVGKGCKQSERSELCARPLVECTTLDHFNNVGLRGFKRGRETLASLAFLATLPNCGSSTAPFLLQPFPTAVGDGLASIDPFLTAQFHRALCLRQHLQM